MKKYRLDVFVINVRRNEMWEIMKDKVKRADGADLLFFGFIALVMIMVFTLVMVDKTVHCYYLKSGSTSAGIAYAVYADTNWSIDEPAFNHSDYKVTLDVYNGLKKCGNE